MRPSAGTTMSEYATRREMKALPRLPLKGTLDLTYRCNNDCVHCWLRLPPGAPEAARELSLDEIRRVAGEARALGCRRWNLFGGEPMLRPDFPEIFDLLTAGGAGYTLNTNGTLITPAIARLLRRPGSKLVSLYGATADVHDGVTRRPGSFDALMRGFALLKEAGAAFTVQIVPMRANVHQLEAMIALAERLSPLWRFGATWLYLSASGDLARNREIAAQRLSPEEAARLDGPIGAFRDDDPADDGGCSGSAPGGFYSACIASRRDFHVDPYGGLSFCLYIKDPGLRYDLRRGSFREGWEEFIPSVPARVPSGASESPCAACDLRPYCRWCSSLAWLESRDHGARLDYLCDVARAAKAEAAAWERDHRRYYRIAGVTIRVDSDLPFADSTFQPKFETFRVDGPGEDTIALHHHFGLPDLDGRNLGREVYRKPPWAIYRRNGSWIYLGIHPDPANTSLHRVAVFNSGHTRARIYHATDRLFRGGGLDALTIFSSDQILLGRVLADRDAFYLHAAGVILDGKGFLFSGPSEAGKSTMVKLLRGRVEVLCDDRTIVRRHDDGFRVHGSWSHGELPDVSASSAPLTGLFFIHQAKENRVERIRDPRLALRRILERVVRPLATADWWDRTLALAERLAREAAVFDLYFDKSGEIVRVLEDLSR